MKPEDLTMAVISNPDDEPGRDRRARITIDVNGRKHYIMERKPGDLAGPDGIITQETRLALERQFAAMER